MSRLPQINNTLLVRHIAQSNLITCSADDTADSLIKIMANQKIGCIVVCENRLPIGIVSRRDLIRLWADPSKPTLVKEFMSSPVLTVSEWTSVDEAGLRFISDEVRHLVVTKTTGEACGIISETDVVNSHGLEHDLFLRSVDEIADHALCIY